MSPRTEDANQKIRDERREQILEAALRVFAYKGLGATKISDIAAAAGISQGLIHHYFSSKEGVYSAVAERAMLGGLGAFTFAGSEAQSPWDRLQAMCARMLEGLADEPEYLIVVIQCLINEDIPSETQEMIVNHGRAMFSNLVQLIQAGQATGQVSAGNPHELATVFLATIQGLALVQFARQIFGNKNPTAEQNRTMPSVETVLRLLKA
jgi:AcrR family transcriptional regulator